jgi:PAS domain S-box-containing protein
MGFQPDLRLAAAAVVASGLILLHALLGERRRTRERVRTLKLLKLLKDQGTLRDLIANIADLMQEWTGCSAVGVRLQEGDDFPYVETRGFAKEVVVAEKSPCDRAERGLKNASGPPALDYMCGNVLCGRFDPTLPFFTARGSFWSNHTTRLWATTGATGSEEHARDRCKGEIYQSVALIPLRVGEQTFGLLQFNDLQKGKFSPDMLSFLEGMADVVGLSLAQRRTQELLAAKEARYREIVETSADGLWTGAANGRTSYVNARMSEVFGYTIEQMMGRKIEDLLFPEDLPAHRQRMAEKRNGPIERYEGRFRGSDGREVWCLVSPRVSQDDSGAASPFVAMLSDITERKRAEIALHESEVHYRSLFEHMLNGVAYCRLRYENGKACDFLYLAVNEAFASLTGLGNVVGKWVSEVIPGFQSTGGKTLETYGRVAATGVPERFETYVAALKMWFWISVFSPRKDHFVAVFDVISERKQAEEERESLHAQLLQAQKMESIGRLAGGIAHDFNNMLSVIIGHAELALDEVPASDPLHEDLWEILSAGRRSANLTRQLLAFARQQTIQPKVIDLNQVVSGMLKMLGRLIGEDIELLWHPQPGLWKVYMDPAQIDQVLANLAVNARDAIVGVGKIALAVSNQVLSEIDCREIVGSVPGHYVRLSVTDTGCGMDKATMARIFEPFFTTKGLGQGTGLGLATVYGVAKQNHGFISVASEPGKGAAFSIFLPRSSSELTTTAEAASMPDCERGTETVLVAEDEENVLRLIRERLSSSGYTVLAASTPQEAIHLAHEHSGPIELLLTDLVMPGMNGRELAEQLAASRPGIHCLFMSGYPSDVAANQGIVDPGLCLLQKPFDVRQLLLGVRKAIDSK